MKQWKFISGFPILMSLLFVLSSCGPWKPLLTEDEPIRLTITFYDEDRVIADGEPVSSAYFMPYDKKYDENDNIIYRNNMETILADIYNTIYEILFLS